MLFDCFDNIWHQMPILSKTIFYEHLPTLAADPRADISMLYICIELL
jgi:hypothetical protein